MLFKDSHLGVTVLNSGPFLVLLFKLINLPTLTLKLSLYPPMVVPALGYLVELNGLKIVSFYWIERENKLFLVGAATLVPFYFISVILILLKNNE